MKILLIEDNRETSATIRQILKEYYLVEVAYTGEDGEYLAQTNIYDLLIIDFVLPDIDGIEVCKRIRSGGIDIPIIILTGNLEIKNKVSALYNGADDYVVKPFSIDELRARIEALLRRTSKSSRIMNSNTLMVGDLVLDLETRIASRGGKKVKLKRKEMDLLEYLMRNVGRVVTRSMILDHIWDSANDSVTNIVDVHIKYLRDHIDRAFEKKLIQTVHGYGYKLEV